MSVKSERKAIIKAGKKRTIGAVSAWAAHNARTCWQDCHYCKR